MIHYLATSLERDEKRREYVRAELSRQDVPYTIIDAIDGARLNEPEYWRQMQDEFPDYLTGRLEDISINHPSIGCFLTHVRALRHCVVHDYENVVIVEDDVSFKTGATEMIERLSQTDLNWDMISLSYNFYPMSKGIPVAKTKLLEKDHSLYLFWRGHLGTVCSLYSRVGICKLLKNLPRWGLSLNFDIMLIHKHHLMGFQILFIRPDLARENPVFFSTILPERNNSTGLGDESVHRHNKKLLSRRKRQLLNIAKDLRTPVKSAMKLTGKAAMIWHCLKYLLWHRKKADPRRRFKLLGSSVVSANTFLFRQFGVRIPWLDPLWVIPDIVIGALYWCSHPSQYRIFSWWRALAKRRFDFRSFAAKPGELTALNAFNIARQAGYYGRWLRQMRILPPTGVLMWNGWRSQWARKALLPKGVKAWYFENSPLPSCLTMDPQGVNNDSYIPRNPDFYLAWAHANPEPAITWQSVGQTISQRPASARHLTTDLALIDELPEKFIFVPLQKQDDSQIYLHAGWVHSIDNFIRTVYGCCAQLPENWSVIVKTHPSDHDIEPDIVFQNRPENVYNGGNFDSVELLKSCSAVVNINGSMGLQAYFFDKPTIVLGNSFYGFGNMARHCNSLDELRDCFANIGDLSHDAHLRGCFLNWLLNHYYLRVPEDLPGRIVTSSLKGVVIDEQVRAQVDDRLLGHWDPWSGLGDDPARWAELAKAGIVADELAVTPKSDSENSSPPDSTGIGDVPKLNAANE